MRYDFYSLARIELEDAIDYYKKINLSKSIQSFSCYLGNMGQKGEPYNLLI